MSSPITAAGVVSVVTKPILTASACAAMLVPISAVASKAVDIDFDNIISPPEIELSCSCSRLYQTEALKVKRHGWMNVCIALDLNKLGPDEFRNSRGVQQNRLNLVVFLKFTNGEVKAKAV